MLSATVPAVAQTLTVAGDCGGVAANCGDDGDRDTISAGLQVDEGDIVTVTFIAEFTSVKNHRNETVQIEAFPIQPAVKSLDELVLQGPFGAEARATRKIDASDLADDIRGHPLEDSDIGSLYERPLTIRRGEPQRTWTFFIREDGVSEGDEWFSFSVGQPVGLTSAGDFWHFANPSSSSVMVTIRGTAARVCSNKETLELIKKIIAERLGTEADVLNVDVVNAGPLVKLSGGRVSNYYSCSARVTTEGFKQPVEYTVRPSAVDEGQFDVEVNVDDDPPRQYRVRAPTTRSAR